MEAGMTDKELCSELGISPPTLRKLLREGPPKGVDPSIALDMRIVPHVKVGKKRFWNREKFYLAIKGEL